MSPINKVQVGFALTFSEKRVIDAKAEKLQVSRSELIGLAIAKVVNHPFGLSNLVLALSAGPDRDKGRKANNSIMVDINDLYKLDGLANRLGLSRNSMLNLIGGGIIINVFD
jgi:hypothetical protein